MRPVQQSSAVVRSRSTAARSLDPETRAFWSWATVQGMAGVDRHLAALKKRRVQDVTASEIARLLRELRGRHSPWTCVAIYRILRGCFALALRRGIITHSPIDGLAPSETPKQRNAKRIAVLEAETMERLVGAGASERWRAALALAGYAGLRLGEVRGLRWCDLDLQAGTLTVSRSLLPDGTPKPPKTTAASAPSRCCPRCGACSSRGGCARRTLAPTTSSSRPQPAPRCRSGTYGGRSRTRNTRPDSTEARSGCRGIRSVTRSPRCWRPTWSSRHDARAPDWARRRRLHAQGVRA